MFSIIKERLRQGHKTIPFPKAPLPLPDRFRGLPELKPDQCVPNCDACVKSCPTSAITTAAKAIQIDLGRCLFCGACQNACETEAITFTTNHRLATTHKEQLVVPGSLEPKVTALQGKMKKLFGRSLKLRQVSAGGCNACEADVNVLSTVIYDMGRFGIDFVASPRHADGILITGPVTHSMKSALLQTFAAIPEPKLVIAQGACAISGGPFAKSPQTCGGIGDLLPVDLYIPGCPPHPATTLDALVRLLDKIK